MDHEMTPREFTILLVSEDAALRAAARQELETVDDRRRVASVSSLDAAQRVIADTAPAVILLDQGAAPSRTHRPFEPHRLNAAVSSLASYAPIVVIGDAEHQSELAALVAAGAADYVVRNAECLTVALGLVERRLRKAQASNLSEIPRARLAEVSRQSDFLELDPQDFGEVLRHELNNPLTGILGNAELLLSEIRRKSDGRLPQGAPQRLETIAALAVRLRETVRRLSQEWETREHTVHTT